MRSAWLVPLLLLTACGSDPGASRQEVEPTPVPAAEAADRDPGDPTLLMTPFTAEEIRAAWVEGLQLSLNRTGPDGPELQRWTVVGADAEGVDIAYQSLDPSGAAGGQPVVQRSSWSELRDHASYPADRASRQRTRRETPLGTLEGWLYTVRDQETGTVTELFFADELPGAPVEMITREDGEVVSKLQQVAREVLAPAS
jgi:hypothetical protein